MVKPRVKKTTRGEIPQELYEQAAYDVINGNAKTPYESLYSEQVCPLPKADLQTKRHYIQTKRKTAIITDTPEKQLLEELYNNRKVFSAKKRYGIKKTGKIKTSQRSERLSKIMEESSEDDTICLICCGPYCSSKRTGCRQEVSRLGSFFFAKNDLYLFDNCESSDSN
ncbi:hypothetical protein JTB14_033911 [Gonioctena quinquepunctata]|nr:hypothetical protein JTB14_033911 [Gonioctena quinquepunctata]